VPTYRVPSASSYTERTMLLESLPLSGNPEEIAENGLGRVRNLKTPSPSVPTHNISCLVSVMAKIFRCALESSGKLAAILATLNCPFCKLSLKTSPRSVPTHNADFSLFTEIEETGKSDNARSCGDCSISDKV